MIAQVVGSADVTSVLAHLRTAVDELLALPLSRLDRDELIALCSDVEQQARRLPAFDHAVIAELDERGLAGQLGTRNTAEFLQQRLRLSPAEARARTTAASELGPRRTLTGEQLAPRYPRVAAAQLAGELSSTHARVITSGLDALPPHIEFEHGQRLEGVLVEQASRLDPAALGRQIRYLLERLDPDGAEPADREHERRRELQLRTNPDGSGELRGRLTPMAAATWMTILDALSAPKLAEDGQPDPRTAAQRRHDALLDAGQRILRSGSLPDAGGAPVTILLHATVADVQSGRGYAETEHGELVSTAEVRRAGDAQPLFALLDATGGIVSYGRARRLATAGQRRALTVRDRGCSFPGCTTPASWCETHHVVAWADGGATDLDNMTLLCGYHHREFERLGWDCVMIDAVPHWRPPDWLDRARTPRRNTAHHTELWLDTS